MELEYRFAGMDELDFLVRMRIRDLRMFSECACRTLLGYAGRELAATATLYFYDVLPSNENPSGRVGQITNVWVDEAFRRQGIATRMVERLMEEARGEAKMVCLNSSEQALGMYERMGFSSKKGYLVYYLN